VKVRCFRVDFSNGIEDRGVERTLEEKPKGKGPPHPRDRFRLFWDKINCPTWDIFRNPAIIAAKSYFDTSEVRP
jgi:hypothetical protein